MYLNTLLAANMCVSFGLDMNQLRRQTLYIKSGLVIVTYMRRPIICLNIASDFAPPPSFVNFLPRHYWISDSIAASNSNSLKYFICIYF